MHYKLHCKKKLTCSVGVHKKILECLAIQFELKQQYLGSYATLYFNRMYGKFCNFDECVTSYIARYRNSLFVAIHRFGITLLSYEGVVGE